MGEQELYELQDGTITEQKPEEEGMIARKRTQEVPVIQSYFLSGSEILDGPDGWPGRMYPNIPVWGKELWVGGKRRLRGAIRHAKDCTEDVQLFPLV